MNGKRLTLAAAFTALALSICSSCIDADPFGRNSCSLTGGYYLERFPENKRFYVRIKGDKSLGGQFDGTILQIGYSKQIILAEVNRLYDGDKDGWYYLHVDTGVIKGPVSHEQIKQNKALANIVVVSAKDAFKGVLKKRKKV